MIVCHYKLYIVKTGTRCYRLRKTTTTQRDNDAKSMTSYLQRAGPVWEDTPADELVKLVTVKH